MRRGMGEVEEERAVVVALDLIHRAFDSRWFEFGYYEYHGENLEADMAALDAEPRNREWLVRCDPMQAPLEGDTGWAIMERVYFNP